MKFNNMKFNDLIVGKMYTFSGWKETTKKAVYADIKGDHFVGLIHATQTFVLLDKFYETYHPATKILSVEGVVGWVWWNPTASFIQQTNEEQKL